MCKYLKIISILLLAMLGTSCSTVTIPKPLPDNIPNENKKQFAGQWMSKEGAISINFDSKGVGKAASLEWSDNKGEFFAEGTSLILTSLDNEYYVSISGKGEGDWMLMQFALIDDDLILWAPDVGRFEELIKAKKLEGDVVKSKHSSKVVLANSAENLVGILKTEKSLFLYKSPTILRKSPK